MTGMFGDHSVIRIFLALSRNKIPLLGSDEQFLQLCFSVSFHFGPGGNGGACPGAVRKCASGLAKLMDSLYKLSLVTGKLSW